MSRPVMSRRKVTLIILLLAAAAYGAGCAARRNDAAAEHQPALAEKMSTPGLGDFGKVNDYLYRGSQPKPEGIEELHKLGIDTIVDLRGERRGVREKEQQHAESLGMRLVNIPGNGWTPPRDEQVAQFFALASESPRRKIFVHCWFGGDRVGMFVAAYRIAFDGWTAEQAIREMKAYHYKEFLHPNLKYYVRKFPERLAKSPELEKYRGMAGSVKPTDAPPVVARP
jgi:protein tyrosine phosphatase (PTP) superfamily phosphohydrolase (DUF442 family)